MRTFLIAILACLIACPALAAEPLFKWEQNKPKNQNMHIGTGAAVGVAAMGLCVEASRRVYDDPHAFECWLATTFFGSLGYIVKESYDTQKYGNGWTLDGVDVLEGSGGATLGAALFVPLVEW